MRSAPSHAMLVLALDTTSRPGSIALARDGEILECHVGAAGRTHAERLPADLLALLKRHGCSLADVEVFAVAAGPGSFTGLRIGIATIQGLAFAHDRPAVAVSALEALVWLGAQRGDQGLIATWIDAQRHEVFSALYSRGPATGGEAENIGIVEGPAVGAPAQTLERWGPLLVGHRVLFIGDGALAYRNLLTATSHADLHIVEPTPPLAPAIARMAALGAIRKGSAPPHAIKPLYVRRPDAELSRSRGLTGD